MTKIKDFVISGRKYTGPIFPANQQELQRAVNLLAACQVGGSVFASSLRIDGGPVAINGSVFCTEDIDITLTATEASSIDGCLWAERTIKTAANQTGPLVIQGDVRARNLKAEQLFVYGNLYASDVALENCVVLGSVIASKRLKIKNCLVGRVKTGSLIDCGGLTLVVGQLESDSRPREGVFKKLRFLLLDDDCSPGFSSWRAINLSSADLISLTDEKSGRTSWQLGLGMRALNSAPFEQRLKLSFQTLANAYLTKFKTDQTVEESFAWERKLLLSISADIGLLEDTFALTSATAAAR